MKKKKETEIIKLDYYLEKNDLTQEATVTQLFLPKGLSGVSELSGNCILEIPEKDPDSGYTINSIRLKDSTIRGGRVSINYLAGNMGFGLLKSIKLPKTVKYLGDFLFSSHTKLEEINLSDVEEISEFAFYKTNLRKVNLGKSLKYLGVEAFSGCRKLESVEFEQNACKEIPSRCFDSCKSLKEIVLPEGITKIGSNAFRKCYDLITIDLPESLREISRGSFYCCGYNSHNVNIIIRGNKLLPGDLIELPFYSNKTRIRTPEKYLLSLYKTLLPLSGNFTIFPLEKGMLRFSESSEGKAIVTAYLDNYTESDNLYTGNIYIPRHIVIERRLIEIVGISDFAFFGTKIESLSVPKDIKFYPYALEGIDNPNFKLIKRDA